MDNESPKQTTRNTETKSPGLSVNIAEANKHNSIKGDTNQPMTPGDKAKAFLNRMSVSPKKIANHMKDLDLYKEASKDAADECVISENGELSRNDSEPNLLRGDSADSIDEEKTANDSFSDNNSSTNSSKPKKRRERSNSLAEMQSFLHKFRKSQSDVRAALDEISRTQDKVDGTLDNFRRRLSIQNDVISVMEAKVQRSTITLGEESKKWKLLRQKGLRKVRVEKMKAQLQAREEAKQKD
eukprot:g2739.t1